MSNPLHPALVHFPIACWTLATIADVASLRWGEPAWSLAGQLMLLGTLTAIAAMATGVYEALRLAPKCAAARDVNRHLLWVTGAWCLYASSLFLRLDGFSLQQPGNAELVLSVAGFAALCVGGRLGGKLVYAYGLGGDVRTPLLETLFPKRAPVHGLQASQIAHRRAIPRSVGSPYSPSGSRR